MQQRILLLQSPRRMQAPSRLAELVTPLSAHFLEAAASTLEHLLLYDTAVGAVQAGEAAAALAQRCVMLARELRGTDLLAERTRRLRRSLDTLEALVTRLLLS
ncbi:hypothetical protein WJX81_000137 [Elliptochloris bilobata]|uniref:Cyclodeaminase/cyclohydrolase domain-containing protein n=1 Tax=Elliptochloris bilobata TaxID=381761 RepID=A0AAW1RM39_9CHLO